MADANVNTAHRQPSSAESRHSDDEGEGEGMMSRQKPLRTFSIACLIINKMIGTGIFITPAFVTALTRNKMIALSLWIFGSIYSYCSVLVYIEYGLAWPFNGGEFVYISKVFPRPPLIFATAFAWFFVCFSTSTPNALMFAKFWMLLGNNENEWLMKFIACWIIVAISILHYRLVNIGILANNCLAAYKVILLLTLVLGGLIATCRDAASNTLGGSGDYATTYPEKSSSTELDQCWDGSDPLNERKVTGTNIALAIFMVLYSYQGWENANYVTSEIKGGPAEKRKRLKNGALWAVTIVSVLYILFNFFLFWLLDFDTIVSQTSTTVASKFAAQTFLENESLANTSMYACIALSSCGNLIGVIFTNGRVKREIARQRIIPLSRMFEKSSTHGRNEWDSLGTPSGGLALHTLVSCITVAALPFYANQDTEGFTFFVNIFTYGHVVLQMFLGIGLFFIRKRMYENETYDKDPEREKGPYEGNWPWNYNILKNPSYRYSTAAFFMIVNLFLAIVPLYPTRSPNGCPRRINTGYLPAVVLLTYAAGAIAGLCILCFGTNFRFKQTRGPGYDEFILHSTRRLRFGNLSWKIQGRDVIKARMRKNYEKDSAADLRETPEMRNMGP